LYGEKFGLNVWVREKGREYNENGDMIIDPDGKEKQNIEKEKAEKAEKEKAQNEKKLTEFLNKKDAENQDQKNQEIQEQIQNENLCNSEDGTCDEQQYSVLDSIGKWFR